MRNKRKSLFMFLIVGITITTKLFSQSLSGSTIKKIDSLFIKWNNNYSPGCAIGIVRNDSLIYAKGYGMANLEYGIPITPETIFYMASVSKQFTAYSIILLARQGKIKLDDDIHVYLPWAPKFGKEISVRNLLNHTSGIRDALSLAAISGLSGDGMLTQDLTLNILKRQRSLNFDPGEKYSYSNSNFILLTEIVKTVSGKSFRSFVDSVIFKPLGMTHSHFEDDYNELIPNRAQSYSSTDSIHFENSFKNVFTFGDGGLYSNVDDMAKWIMNFYKPQAGDINDIEQLTTRGKLNNGKEILYAAGIVSNHYKGWRMFTHLGGLAGYCTMTAVYPDLKTGFIVFGNQGDLSTLSKPKQLADILLTDNPSNRTNEKEFNEDNSNACNTINLKNFVGNYIADDGMLISFRVTNDNLYADAFGQSFLLLKEKTDPSTFFSAPLMQFSFSNLRPGLVLATFPAEDDEKYTLKKYVAYTSMTDKLLQTYAGTYYCSELDCKYGITLKDHHLFITSNKYNDAQLTLIDANHLVNDLWWMNNLLITRNNLNQITGFEVNSGGVMHLKFNKLPSARVLAPQAVRHN